jgi:hypothetical protein
MKFPKLSYPPVTKLPLLLLAFTLVIVSLSANGSPNRVNHIAATNGSSPIAKQQDTNPHTVQLQSVLGSQTTQTAVTDVPSDNNDSSSGVPLSSSAIPTTPSPINSTSVNTTTTDVNPSTNSSSPPNACQSCSASDNSTVTCPDHCIAPETAPAPAPSPQPINTCQPCGNLPANSLRESPRMCALYCTY